MFPNKPLKVCILTSVHFPFDTRIFHKEAKSLIKAGYEVTLVAQHDEKEMVEGIRIVPLHKPRNRFERMTRMVWHLYKNALKVDANIYHFHDPELISVGLLLKIKGKKVIYDVHEDVPRQIHGKHWISPAWRRPMAWLSEICEWMAAKVFDGIVTATPMISRRFSPRKTETIQNFPILSELVVTDPVPYAQRPPHFVYVGGITGMRGAKEMVQAIGQVQNPDARLQLAGAFQQQVVQAKIETLPDWCRVEFHGWINRTRMTSLLSHGRAGLVLFHPAPNHIDAQPNKMFEYMAAGLPVIASDFAFWREIIDHAGCGLLVDPLDPEAIAQAMQWTLDNPEEAEAMGKRGRQAVEEKYNWERESVKLVAQYKRLLVSE